METISNYRRLGGVDGEEGGRENSKGYERKEVKGIRRNMKRE